MQKYNLITILGATAVGKTFLASQLAKVFNGEIISADSRQVYRGMDIGTGKDLQDYVVDDFHVPFHLIDVAEPTEEYNLFQFVKDFTAAFQIIKSHNKIPFLVGGTGLYLDAVLKNYLLKESLPDKDYQDYLRTYSLEELQNKLLKLNPALHNTTDLLDKERVIRAIEIAVNASKEIEKPEINSIVIGVRLERTAVKERITTRLKIRLDSGMIEEVARLVENGLSYDKLSFFGLEYRYIGLYLQGKLSFNDMFQKLNSSIQSFSKRQGTWFRKIEREGIFINWIDGADFEKAARIIKEKYFLEFF
ncbi:MAG: tRNA (adenosine(37)-N6)-dimethylallyltransferase MiaA [Ignavibacteriales bacterium]|nr:tRNA (adenosine(37)-N6)-dimethylallyltransferase MiaA [Ignavibacteriales bacterium]